MKVADFGIARALPNPRSRARHDPRLRPLLQPGSAGRARHAASDITLGIVLFELLTAGGRERATRRPIPRRSSRGGSEPIRGAEGHQPSPRVDPAEALATERRNRVASSSDMDDARRRTSRGVRQHPRACAAAVAWPPPAARWRRGAWGRCGRAAVRPAAGAGAAGAAGAPTIAAGVADPTWERDIAFPRATRDGPRGPGGRRVADPGAGADAGEDDDGPARDHPGLAFRAAGIGVLALAAFLSPTPRRAVRIAGGQVEAGIIG